MPNTGLSTPADIEWSHRRPGASSATRMNGAARSGHASPEKNVIVIRAMSASATGSSPVSRTASTPGATARTRSPYMSQNVSVQNSVPAGEAVADELADGTEVIVSACQATSSSTNSANTAAYFIASASSCITEISHCSSSPGGSSTPRLMPWIHCANASSMFVAL